MKFNRILAIILTCLMVLGAMVLGLQGKPVNRDDSLYLTDKAGVISPAVESQFVQMQKNAAPRLSVAIVQSTGKLSTEAYCETLWNNWRMGTSDVLLLMVIGKEDYYLGYDYSSSFAEVLDANFDVLMETYLEPDFAARDYESAILTFSQGMQAVTSMSFNDNLYFPYEDYGGYSSAGSGTVFLLVLVYIVLVLAVIAVNSIGKKRPGTTVVYHKPSAPGSYKPSGTSYRPSTSYKPSSTVRPGTSTFRPSSTVRPSSSRPSSRPGGFGGGGRSSGGFSGGSRSSGGRSMGGGGRSGGMGGRGRR